MIHTLLPISTQKEHAGRETWTECGVGPKLHYSFPISETEKPHAYVRDVYSALGAFKALDLNKMV